MASATNCWRVGFFFGVNYIHTMQFPSCLICGILIQWYQRFLVDVRVASGAIVMAHCTNTGSMMGCKAPGSAVYISRSNKEKRRLLYTWEMIRVDGGWVGINTLHPNRLVAEGIESGVIRELRGCESIRREICTRQGTRLDLCLQDSNGSCFVKIKNVTLTIDKTAAFPDA